MDSLIDDIIITYGTLFICISLIFRLILLIIQCIYVLPNYSNKIEKLFARIIYNLFFIFYLFGFCLLLFDFDQLQSFNVMIKLSLIGFIIQLVIIPLLSLWQIYQSNAYLWQ